MPSSQSVSAYGEAQRTRQGQRVELEHLPGSYLLVYPNVIELWYHGHKDCAWTSQQWGEMVHKVGITGLS